MRDTLVRALWHPLPWRVLALRALARRLPIFSYPEALRMSLVERPHYGYCIYEAGRLASRLGHDVVSVIEFGCGGGNGLLNAEYHIAQVEKLFPVKFQLYGFDGGTGLPPTTDHRDFPHYFQPGQFPMDVSALRARLTLARLVLGPVAETVQTFQSTYNPAPVGCVLHDLDFYSSTRDALTLFDTSTPFLPRVFMYFDDLDGDPVWLPNEFTGELLAINEFNASHKNKKIAYNRSLHGHHGELWRSLMYVYHDFDHPDYNRFVGGSESAGHDERIRLANS